MEHLLPGEGRIRPSWPTDPHPVADERHNAGPR